MLKLSLIFLESGSLIWWVDYALWSTTSSSIRCIFSWFYGQNTQVLQLFWTRSSWAWLQYLILLFYPHFILLLYSHSSLLGFFMLSKVTMWLSILEQGDFLGLFMDTAKDELAKRPSVISKEKLQVSETPYTWFGTSYTLNLSHCWFTCTFCNVYHKQPHPVSKVLLSIQFCCSGTNNNKLAACVPVLSVPQTYV